MAESELRASAGGFEKHPGGSRVSVIEAGSIREGISRWSGRLAGWRSADRAMEAVLHARFWCVSDKTCVMIPASERITMRVP